MNATSETFEDRLLPMLLEARPSHKRRRRGGRIAAAATAIVAVGVSVLSLSLGPAVGTDTVTVSARDAIADPKGTEEMLRQDGIDATVVVVPVSPYWKVLNQTWWWLHFDGPVDLSQHDFANIYRQVGDGLTGLTTDEMDHGEGVQHFPDLELPKNMPGHITLFAAEVTHGPAVGSGYDQSNELSPLGTFWCDGLDANDPATVGAALKRLGYDVIWVREPEDDSADAPASWSHLSSPPPGTVVTWAWLRGPSTVDVRLMTAGVAARRYQQDEGTFLPGDTPPWTQRCPS